MVTLMLSEGKTDFAIQKDLQDFLGSQAISARVELPFVATSMGILAKSKSDRGEIRLSALGEQLVRFREEVRGDLLHFLMYTGWQPTSSLDFLQSWSYRQCCDRYWSASELDLTNAYLDLQVEETILEAKTAFQGMGFDAFEEVSFSRKSLTGAYRWLEALRPEVIVNVDKGRRFVRRAFCPPELLMLAFGYVLRDESDVAGIDVLLTHEKREALCKVCLLAPEWFDKSLDWAIPTFPTLISAGTSAGFYGRFVRLTKLPEWADVAR